MKMLPGHITGQHKSGAVNPTIRDGSGITTITSENKSLKWNSLINDLKIMHLYDNGVYVTLQQIADSLAEAKRKGHA